MLSFRNPISIDTFFIWLILLSFLIYYDKEERRKKPNSTIVRIKALFKKTFWISVKSIIINEK